MADEMKPRHAGALALVGWYLMSPLGAPLKAGKGGLDLSNWTVVGRYKSDVGCENERSGWLARALAGINKRNTLCANCPDNSWQEFWDSEQALCVASDDPRIKGN
jgi:hypothetical protein